ncbi:hypothetical protein KZZ07_14210 [Mameliella sp. CS4]|uniref:hypothetical protein n=1 Tax=Mameliella sp. CS4 TaxID=2862329 RepID=UPI001C60102A|nr:hypothetical protein [Mameliella sp. CS4]MBW4983696.1 hypothetical protein [Mameliella sp. CS4]
MTTLEDLRNARQAELRLAQAQVALCDALMKHARTLEADRLAMDVETDSKGKLSIMLRLDNTAAPISAPAATKPGDWTDDEDMTLLAEAEKGTPVKQIAARVGRSWQAVAKRLKTLKQAQDEESGEPEATPASAPAASPTATTRDPGETGLAISLDGLGTAREKAAERRLRALGYPAPHSPQSDLKLVESIMRGDGMSLAANTAGIEKDAAGKRWKALMPEVTIENQTALLTVLRLRDELERRASGQAA